MKKIMIVDDTQFMRMRISKLLTQHGYQTIEAANGEEAVRMYKQAEPDAVIMDITMPLKNGIDALSEIRAIHPQAKVIMLTALGQQEMALQALQAGAKDFLVKPYDQDQVIKSLQKVLSKN